MLSDVRWRKMPIDLLTNETMNYIASQMPEGLEFAPFMFYQAALKKAGDDGEFDLEDGVIFARLMRVSDVTIVFKIANLMAQRRVIYHVAAGSNKCLLADWEYSDKKQPRTLAERRAIVQHQIDAKKAMPIIKEEFAPITSSENVQPSFICPDDDKNQKNVVKNVYDDKNTKNVVKKNETEREEREIRERDKREETHTERESLREGVETSAELPEGSATVPTPEKKAVARKTKKAETKTEEVVTDSVPASYDSSLADEALKSGETKAEGKNQEIESVLEAFFLNYSFGYNLKKGHPHVEALAKRIKELATSEAPGPLLAQTLCDAFKKMHDEPGNWKDIPLLPLYMAKDGVWAHLLAIVSNKFKGKRKKSFLDQAKEYEIQAEKEREDLITLTDSEYEDYGIDPNDPAKAQKLLIAKSAESKQYEGDIF